jgi:hypothetical protein
MTEIMVSEIMIDKKKLIILIDEDLYDKARIASALDKKRSLGEWVRWLISERVRELDVERIEKIARKEAEGG